VEGSGLWTPGSQAIGLQRKKRRLGVSIERGNRRNGVEGSGLWTPGSRLSACSEERKGWKKELKGG